MNQRISTQAIETSARTRKSSAPRLGLGSRVYGHYGSACTNRVLLALAEKGAAYEFELVDLSKDQQKQAEHLARHPFGVIPFYRDRHVELYESDAICRYLDRALPGQRLVPEDAVGEARMNQWLSVAQCYFTPAMAQLFRHKFLNRMRGEPCSQDAIVEARVQLSRVFDVLERALSVTRHLAGDFSLADIFYMPSVGMLFFLEEAELVTARPHLADWWQRVSARPSFQAVSRLME